MTPSLVFEIWSEGAKPGKNAPGGFLSGGVTVDEGRRDVRSEKMAEFGGNVGMTKLLDLLAREDVRASILINGRCAELWPDVVRRAHDEGHELVGHSYAQDISVYDFTTPEEERDNIRRTVEAIASVTGVPPRGWIGPRASASPWTVELLAEEGFIWMGDYPDDELPYLLKTGDATIVSIPYSGTAGVNDYDVAVIQGNPPRDYVDTFSDTFDYLYEDFAITGEPGMLRLSVHAHVYGRPFGRHAFRDAIRYAKSYPGVWVATRGEIADWVLKQAG